VCTQGTTLGRKGIYRHGLLEGVTLQVSSGSLWTLPSREGVRLCKVIVPWVGFFFMIESIFSILTAGWNPIQIAFLTLFSFICLLFSFFSAGFPCVA
jgi:hypothetical protein